jgi:hypothetical protein
MSIFTISPHLRSVGTNQKYPGWLADDICGARQWQNTSNAMY